MLRLNHSWVRPTEPASLCEDEVFLHVPETTGLYEMAEAMAVTIGTIVYVFVAVDQPHLCVIVATQMC